MTVTRLYSGIYRCCDCEAEWQFERAPELRCHECGGNDLELLDPSDDE